MKFPRPSLIVCLLLIVALGATAGYFAYAYMEVRREALIFKREVEVADREVQRLQQRLEAERVLSQRQQESLNETGDLALLRMARLGDPAAPQSPVVAVVVWNPATQHGLLIADGLTATDEQTAYQMWVVDPTTGHTVGAGVFRPDQRGAARVDFTPVQPMLNASEFRITRERATGAARPRGPLIASGRL